MGEAERIIEEYARRGREISPERYSATSPGQMAMEQSKERAAATLLRRAGVLPLEGKKALEVGCGTGGWLPKLESWGVRRADLAGIDLLADDVHEARTKLAPVAADDGARALDGADIRVGDAARLPWGDASFDLVVQSVVFTSVLDDEMRRRISSEMARVLRPEGAILWFDFFAYSPRNRSSRPVSRRELAGLFSGFELQTRRVLLAAPLSRALAPRSWFAVQALEALRILNTHYMALLTRSPSR